MRRRFVREISVFLHCTVLCDVQLLRAESDVDGEGLRLADCVRVVSE
jgi:hypothetical protein